MNWLESALTVTRRPEYFGRVRINEFTVLGHQSQPGHTHDEDHVTVLGEGVFLLRKKLPNGKMIERSYRVPRYGIHIELIDKDVEHEFVNLTDQPLNYYCIFSTLDETGELAEAYARSAHG